MNSFILSRATQVVLNQSNKPIENAKSIFMRDLFRGTLIVSQQNRIVLEQSGELLSEEYIVTINPDTIYIVYHDDLGAIYALLSLSERFLGILPFGFWNDQVLLPVDFHSIPCQTYSSKKQIVKYRGWMINDEVLLEGWKDTEEELMEIWRQIYETLLRCGGNMIIPGTDRKNDYEVLTDLALDMGLWVTHHHTELLGAKMFSRIHPDKEASYIKYPEQFEKLWADSIHRYAGRKIIWTVGYRGQGDTAFWSGEKGFDTDEKRGAMIVHVINRQIELVQQIDPQAIFCTNLYGEMMALYRRGFLPLPKNVIKIWADNGYGKMVNRRTDNTNERIDSMPQDEDGKNGIYYHAAFYDLQAANHITMLPNEPMMIAKELTTVIDNKATIYWLINIGSLKPHIYILDLIRLLWSNGSVDIPANADLYAVRYYGDSNVAPLLMEYSKSAMLYGIHSDEHAGDQFYHFVLRHIIRAVMRGQTKQPIKPLLWLTDDLPFTEQIKKICHMCYEAAPRWTRFLHLSKEVKAKLNHNAAQLLEDTLILQGFLHQTGCEAMVSICQSVLSLVHQEPVKAYLLADQARTFNQRGISALDSASHDRFEGFYRNECFSNVRLTVQMLTTYRAWIRACFDGENYYDWERNYLFPPEDRRIWCLTHRRNQLDDDTLCAALRGVINLA